MAEQKIAVTAEDLKEILRTVVEEAKKPVVTERDAREMKEAQEARAANCEQIEEERRNKQYLQSTICRHRRRNNEPRTAHVKNNPKSGGEFLICQACQAIIRREDEKGRRYENDTIYDTELFNSLVIDQSPVIW